MWPPRPALPSYASSSANLAHLAAERPTSQPATQMDADAVDAELPARPTSQPATRLDVDAVDAELPARPALVPYASSSPSSNDKTVPAVEESISNQPATQPIADSAPSVSSARARRWASSSDGTCDFMVAAGTMPNDPLSTPIAKGDKPLDPSTITRILPSPEELEQHVPIPRVSIPRISILASSDPPTATPTPSEPLPPTKGTTVPTSTAFETPTPPAPPIPSSLQALWTTLTGDQRIRLITAWLEMAPTPQQRAIFRALLANHVERVEQLSFAYMTIASIEALDPTLTVTQLPPQPHPRTLVHPPQSPNLVDTTMLDVFTPSPTATASATATQPTTSTSPRTSPPQPHLSRSHSHPPYTLLSPPTPPRRHSRSRSHPQSPPWKAYRVLGIYPSRSPFEPIRSMRVVEETELGGYFDGGASSTGLDAEAGGSRVRLRLAGTRMARDESGSGGDSPSQQIYGEVKMRERGEEGPEAGDQNASPQKEMVEEWSSPGAMIPISLSLGGLVWW
ncbi:uncharacterized protein BDZ99DRAFT_477499 [Mytilinidion resinicola]|uniref:Uncharacterized protein n=1 Tax=Mytilinidion resinicola TaxID=574789 RepID=A0A6A6YM05_9PEZI|nr:uncharacterized protein BDZ99DRAFT_477499 [Mytilinidion resinicola]KAF2809014.1 hypothetical protein BDZ99DRAFT_477499 [Mytilinidion resinicola]